MENICSTTRYQVYKKRWFILFLYSINSMNNAVLFNCIGAINSIAAPYWRVQPNIIDWLPNSFLLIYIFIALPSAYFITKLGLRLSMIVLSSLNAISAALHFAGYLRGGFPFVLGGQVAAAISNAMVIQLPAAISTVWFCESEHAKATSISIFMNILGVGIGFLQPSQMVPESDINATKAGMFNMFLSQLIFFGFFLFLVYMFFDEKPKTPPSFAAACINGSEHQIEFKASLKKLATDFNFVLLVQIYGLYFGMFVFFSIVLNEMLHDKVSATLVGWIGFSANMFSIVGAMINGILIDKYKCYKSLSMTIMFFSLLSWIAFTLSAMYTDSVLGIFIAFSFVGYFGIPYFALGVEQAAEMTYPIPEVTSSAVILIAGNTCGFLFVFILGPLIDKGKLPLVCYITIGVYGVAFLLSCFIKINLKRHTVEVTHTVVADCVVNSMLEGRESSSDYEDDEDDGSGSEFKNLVA